MIYWTHRIFEVERFLAVVVDGFLVMGLPVGSYCGLARKLFDQVECEQEIFETRSNPKC